MDIFMIGGTGFISGHVVRMLLEAGHRVTTFTRGKTAPGSASHPHLTQRHGDRDDEAALRQALDGRTFDAVYDMIAYAPEASAAAVRVFKGRTGRFIHCSTVSVYMVSNDVRCPVTEDQAGLPLMPSWPRNPFGMTYGVQKRRCEDVLWAAHDPHTFPVSMLRPTYVSGPGDPTRRDYFWIERILDGRPLLVPGSGDCAFQLVYVEDVARAFARLLEQPASLGKAYNVAGEDLYSLNEYLLLLAGLLGREVTRVPVEQAVFDRLPFSSHPHGDVFPFNTQRTAVFSLERIRTELQYRSTPFAQWMARTIDWYRREDAAPSRGYDRRDEEVAFAEAWQRRQATALDAL
jgi:nucleoside-diphosphate-sugar epimerase